MRFFEFHPTTMHLATVAGEVTSLIMLSFVNEYPGLASVLYWEIFTTALFGRRMWQESRNASIAGNR